MIYIFDIDGTLADCGHRLHYLQKPDGTKPDWEGFFDAAVDDAPIWPVITVARALTAAGHTLVFMTGRPESHRQLTTQWLVKYRVPFDFILMRKDGDHREDFVVKRERFLSLPYLLNDIGGVFEDRQQNVDMFRSLGIKVFQVAKGDF